MRSCWLVLAVLATSLNAAEPSGLDLVASTPEPERFCSEHELRRVFDEINGVLVKLSN